MYIPEHPRGYNKRNIGSYQDVEAERVDRRLKEQKEKESRIKLQEDMEKVEKGEKDNIVSYVDQKYQKIQDEYLQGKVNKMFRNKEG